MVVTPGDILQSCQVLSARIQAADEVIEGAPEVFDDAFRASWRARMRRWAEVRHQCGDFGSRWWNYKWGPILDDWRANQTAWERIIEGRSGVAIAVPEHDPSQDERPLDRLGDGLSQWAQIGLGALVASAALAIVVRASRVR